jgi:hypothetical protein
MGSKSVLHATVHFRTKLNASITSVIIMSYTGMHEAYILAVYTKSMTTNILINF